MRNISDVVFAAVDAIKIAVAVAASEKLKEAQEFLDLRSSVISSSFARIDSRRPPPAPTSELSVTDEVAV